MMARAVRQPAPPLTTAKVAVVMAATRPDWTLPTCCRVKPAAAKKRLEQYRRKPPCAREA